VGICAIAALIAIVYAVLVVVLLLVTASIGT
jgi:hypothetical protein